MRLPNSHRLREREKEHVAIVANSIYKSIQFTFDLPELYPESRVHMLDRGVVPGGP